MQKVISTVIAKPWAQSCQKVLEHLTVSAKNGLDKKNIKKRRKQYGPNRLREIKRKNISAILFNQVKSLIVLLLSVAAILSFFFQEWADGIAIAAVILVNTMIGFLMELKAARSMESLRRMERVTARVRRAGKVNEIIAPELVPGDIVVLEGGDIVSADMRLIQTSKLQADESVLTGESVPVSKQTKTIEEDTAVCERSNMLFKGTAVTRGSGEAVVVGTGMNTELGQISSLIEEAEDVVTPLEKRLDKLGHKLLWVTLGIIVFVAAVGIARGKDTLIMIETAIALAVAAVPEGLPIVATLALARGMIRMARRNALVNRLAAVETLGGTGVICTDKTGTLTENKMTVTQIYTGTGQIIIKGGESQGQFQFKKNGDGIEPKDNELLMRALEAAALCNNASLAKNKNGNAAWVGDPLEGALLVAAAKAGIDRSKLVQRFPEEREEAFDPDLKMMATFHKHDNHYRVAVKGAPEAVLDICSFIQTCEGNKKLNEQGRKHWAEQNTKMADKGLRILAVATKNVESLDAEPYEELTLLGLIAMADPPRRDVSQAISLCQDAGIKVIMVTGDQPKTAHSIASSVGLIKENERQEVILGKDVKSSDEISNQQSERYLNASIFARVSPKQKLNLIDIHQKNGSVVAMTGDGVNDAPALKKADIGIAMGQRGTQVAREAADMVLRDDAFSTIVAAIEQGRVIFNNIRKFVLYLLSCNVSEVMVVFLASLVNAPLPILPLQILFLNLVTDVFPALALGFGSGEPEIMKFKPRNPTEPIITGSHWMAIAGYGLLITVSVLGSFALAFKLLKMTNTQAVTISFLTLAFAQLWHIGNMRGRGSALFRNEIFGNPYVWMAIILCTVLLIAAVYVPALSSVLKLSRPGLAGWVLIIILSLIPFGFGQFLKSINTGSLR